MSNWLESFEELEMPEEFDLEKIDLDVLADTYNKFWSSTATTLSNIAEEFAKSSVDPNNNKAINSKIHASTIAKKLDSLSAQATHYANDLEKIVSKNPNHGKIKADFRAEYAQKILDTAKANRDSFLKKAVEYAAEAKHMGDMGKYFAPIVGYAVNVANYGLKLKDKDYYGAASVGATFLATIKLTPALLRGLALFIPGGIPLILLSTVLAGVGGYAIDKLFNSLLNNYDPLDISSKTNTDYQSAKNFVQYVDPLVLDLDGDGIETISANSGITFDFNDDGLKTGTGWISGDDGFLVLDRNGNGTIDNGRELFGVDTVKSDGTLAKDGFDALRDLDSNGDGVFDAYDLLFEQMRVWQDKNQDGISQADELKSLNELGISAIHLDNSSSNRLDNGNRISATGTIEFADGSTGTVANIDLASNPFYREFLDKLPISKSIQDLPNMYGSGAVRDLQEAASQSKELANLLKQYSKLPTREKQRAMLDNILGAWANTTNYPNLSQRLQKAAGDNVEVELQFSWQQKGSKPTAEQLAQKALLEKTAILEVFNASDFYKITRRSDGKFILQAGTSSTVLGATKMEDGKEKLIITENNLQLNVGQAGLLNQSYNSLLNSVYQGLLLQTRLKPYLEAIGITITEEGIALDYNGLYKTIDKKSSDPVEAIVTSFEIQELLQDTALSTVLENRRSAWISKLDEKGLNRLHAQMNDGYFTDLQGGHLAIGTNGSDTLYGKNSSNSTSQLYGGAGDDTLQVYAYSKDNLLAGGTGNDTLYGGYYSDTYLFNLGDGKDTIIETYSYSGAIDTLRFGKDIKATDISTYKDGRDLLFKHKNGKDEVRVKNVFNSTGSGATASEHYNIERVEFADGTVWTWKQIAERGLISQANNNGETLYGWAGNDIMQGGKGDDILDAGDGSNTLYGGDGNDTIKVGNYSFDNILAGGKGNDTLYGSYYSDTYLFNLGDGKDTIIESYSYSGAIDTLRFGKDIKSADISTYKDGRDLLFKHKNSKDEVRVKNVFNSTGSGATASGHNNIERVEFADGTVWTWKQIAERGLIRQANNNGETLYGWTGNDIMQGGKGDDILDAGDGSNTLYGGDGNDTIKVGNYSFDNILAGGKGNDWLYGSYYSDTYLFNRDDGQDTIVENYSYNNAIDIVQFGKGINPNNLWFERSGYDLTVSIHKTDGRITIKNWYSNTHARIEQFHLANGKMLLESQVQNLVDAMAAFSGSSSAEGDFISMSKQELDKVIAVNWQ